MEFWFLLHVSHLWYPRNLREWGKPTFFTFGVFWATLTLYKLSTKLFCYTRSYIIIIFGKLESHSFQSVRQEALTWSILWVFLNLTSVLIFLRSVGFLFHNLTVRLIKLFLASSVLFKYFLGQGAFHFIT